MSKEDDRATGAAIASDKVDKQSSKVRGVLILGVLLALIAGVYAVFAWRDEPEPQALALPSVDVTVTPADAQIRIDGQVAGTAAGLREVSPGPHDIEVIRRGYQPWKQSVVVDRPMKVSVDLEPIPMELHVLTGLRQVEMWLDDQPQAPREDGSAGEFVITAIPEGLHTLRMKTASGETAIPFEFQYGTAPVPQLPSGNPTILFVSGFGDSVRIECNCRGQFVLAESTQPVEPGTAASLSLAEGQYSGEFRETAGSRRMVTFSVGQAPWVTATIWSSVKTVKPPPPDTQTLLDNAAAQLKAARCDSADALLRQVLSREPGNADAAGMQLRIARLRSLGGCQ